MAIAPQALKALDLTDVLGTVHAALSLNFEEYAAAMNGDNFVEALTLLTNQHSLVRQAEFLIAELSDAYGVDTVPAVDPDQLELKITVTDGVTTMDATPAAPAQTDAAELVSHSVPVDLANAVFGERYGIDWRYYSPIETRPGWLALPEVERRHRAKFGCSQLPPAGEGRPVEKERAREDVREPTHVVANNVSFDLANMAFGSDWMYAHGAEGVDPAAVFTAEQVAKRVADKPLSQVESLPRGGESIHQLELPPGLVASEALVADTEAAARVCGSLVAFFAGSGQPAEANTMADAQEILLRGSGGAAAVRRTVEPQTFPAVAAGDMALFDNFAINPDTDPQLIVGLLGTDNVLVWQMAGTVPEGAFTTLRQRLQMFADTTDCVALARVRA